MLAVAATGLLLGLLSARFRDIPYMIASVTQITVDQPGQPSAASTIAT